MRRSSTGFRNWKTRQSEKAMEKIMDRLDEDKKRSTKSNDELHTHDTHNQGSRSRTKPRGASTSGHRNEGRQQAIVTGCSGGPRLRAYNNSTDSSYRKRKPDIRLIVEKTKYTSLCCSVDFSVVQLCPIITGCGSQRKTRILGALS
jgi:hypothetical protein